MSDSNQLHTFMSNLISTKSIEIVNDNARISWNFPPQQCQSYSNNKMIAGVSAVPTTTTTTRWESSCCSPTKTTNNYFNYKQSSPSSSSRRWSHPSFSSTISSFPSSQGSPGQTQRRGIDVAPVLPASRRPTTMAHRRQY